MRETTHFLGRLTPILGCLILAGCGPGDGLARVNGTVTLNGEPLGGAIVQFQPVEEGGTPSAGKTDAKGRYELMHTFDQRGAVPGEHVVSIRTAAAYYDEEGGGEERIPAEYNDRTELKRTVEPGSNTFDFEL
jgi:hypothetical protein